MENRAEEGLTTKPRGLVFLMGIERTGKINAFALPMLRSLMATYTEYESSDQLRCAVLFAHGDHFTAGIDLASVKAEHFVPPAGLLDPRGIHGPGRTKPVGIAIHGGGPTNGLELALASRTCLAGGNAPLRQIQIQRGS